VGPLPFNVQSEIRAPQFLSSSPCKSGGQVARFAVGLGWRPHPTPRRRCAAQWGRCERENRNENPRRHVLPSREAVAGEALGKA